MAMGPYGKDLFLILLHQGLCLPLIT